MIYFLMAIFILMADIFTKKWICRNIKLGQKKEIVKKRLYFWYIKNKGAAYNSFEGHMTIIKCICVVGTIFCASRIGKGSKTDNIAYSFLLGGALGNLLERFRYGTVTDFIYLDSGKKYSNTFFQKIIQKYRPIFNIADIFIALGAMILLFANLLQKEK